jgi:hypothetical protein
LIGLFGLGKGKAKMGKSKERKELSMSEEREEKMELSHEPVPGYRAAFFIAITIGALYLGVILYQTLA